MNSIIWLLGLLARRRLTYLNLGGAAERDLAADGSECQVKRDRKQVSIGIMSNDHMDGICSLSRTRYGYEGSR